ncbi:MAG: M48 family metallopeptidase [Rhodospirillales bacterium]|nr:M48 family metallopeptidase [Rhodospirillales bacterium]
MRIFLDLEGVRTPLHVRQHPRARRASLRLSADGNYVIVVLPPRTRSEEGLAIARAHASWIRAKLDDRPPRVPFADGAVLPVNGQALTVCLVPGGQRGVRTAGDRLLASGPADAVADQIRTWLRTEARRVILLRIAEKAARLVRQPTRVSLRDTRSRWGSCSLKGALSFSWRLILAPAPVLDYVVAHELAHLAHHGHGPAFWTAVGDLCDEISAGRTWLRQHGRSLFRYG